MNTHGGGLLHSRGWSLFGWVGGRLFRIRKPHCSTELPSSILHTQVHTPFEKRLRNNIAIIPVTTTPYNPIARIHLAHLALNAKPEFAVICGTVVNKTFAPTFTIVTEPWGRARNALPDSDDPGNRRSFSAAEAVDDSFAALSVSVVNLDK